MRMTNGTATWHIDLVRLCLCPLRLRLRLLVLGGTPAVALLPSTSTSQRQARPKLIANAI